MTPEEFLRGEGDIYFAPAGTEPPTSKASLEAAGWQRIGRATAEAAQREEEQREEEQPATEKHWTLNLDYRLPEPYQPNRATRRALARNAKRAQR